MISRLTVSNIAVVEKADVELASGLNVITGETGAGKSVLMGALELVLGARADALRVRDGAKEAKVEVVFEGLGSRVDDILEDAGLEPGEVLSIRRTVGAAGGTRVWINDSASTVATLKRLAARLVDIHGPRANQNILDGRFQRATLDSFGSVPREEYGAAWAKLEETREEISRLEAADAPEDELELLRYQTAEIEEAAITEEDDSLADRHAAAAHAADIISAANDITEALGGDGGASEALSRAQTRLRAVLRFFPQAADWGRELDELAIRADELSREVAQAASRLDDEASELAAMDARLSVVNRLLRKYRVASASGLLETLARKKARLEELETRDKRLEALRDELKRRQADVEAAGGRLLVARAKAGARLAKAVTAELHGLGFLKARFAVEVAPSAPAREGCDMVAFVFEPNPGERARALADIASSGETARVMLALKTVLAEHDGTDVLVFDEIDANIGGETGRAVGERMRRVARHHQVIAITHLPQSAVYGAHHLVVTKVVSGGRTRTRIEAAAGEARTDEIARMLGGGAAARAHARELIDTARPNAPEQT